jgi:hypothetical protein
VHAKVLYWKSELARIAPENNVVKEAGIYDQVSQYAGHLIRSHRNNEFLELARLMDFSFNHEVDEAYVSEGRNLSYGRNLLEDAILSKNHVAYDALKDLGNQAPEGSMRKPPRIAVWTQVLAKAAEEDPHFSKDLLTIRTQFGTYDKKLSSNGVLNEDKMEVLKDIEKSHDMKALFEILSGLFASGHYSALIHHSGKTVHAGLDYTHREYSDEDPYSQPGDEWLRIRIRDSSLSNQSLLGRVFGGGIVDDTYISKFDLILGKYVSTDKYGLKGQQVYLEERQGNWIAEMKVEPNQVRILIERDRDGQSFDLGTRYQELTLRRESSGRVTDIQIRNGQNLLLRSLWKSQTIQIPNDMRGASEAFIPGHEDLTNREVRN